MYSSKKKPSIKVAIQIQVTPITKNNSKAIIMNLSEKGNLAFLLC